ncbi:hypothetical protein H1P_1000021 [Hyella patelloides LEGE 07179]|uniref:Uncharacterized protein n=1 Tax=Hyella patelloides LEGE 07179 TaxID=945734 RepID=A0A563VIU1_9CYAN|nr:hypothetical protein H1P_1000021 [Hyella patelloides LEGE 07179]
MIINFVCHDLPQKKQTTILLIESNRKLSWQIKQPSKLN